MDSRLSVPKYLPGKEGEPNKTGMNSTKVSNRLQGNSALNYSENK